MRLIICLHTAAVRMFHADRALRCAPAADQPAAGLPKTLQAPVRRAP